ncbi:MAG: type VII secretion protein EssC [Bacilli bacterium]|nr:type VII secretion protein EssC [Bacilli bacterium]
MKLYLADEEKINTFNLPEKVEESFLFSYTPNFTNIEVFLNITSSDNNWHLKRNDDIQFKENANDILLENYKHYKIKIKGNPHEFYLYTYDSYNNNYRDYSYSGIDTITIGNNTSDTIVYGDELAIAKQVVISIKEGFAYITCNEESKANLYINKRKITKETLLYNGDTIFINNIKIIWMGTFFRMFLTDVDFSISSILQNITDNNVTDNSSFTDYKIKENDIELYSDEDYFFHKPRLLGSYDEENVKIDGPTAQVGKDDIPFLFSIGTGLTMVISSSVLLYKAISGYKVGETTKEDLIITIISSVAVIVFSFFIPKIAQIYNEKRAKKKNLLREEKYGKYLNKKTNEINKILKAESQAIFNNNPSAKDCYENVIGVKNKLWERDITDSDFLTVRLGLGNIPSAIDIDYPQEKFELDEDELILKAQEVANTSKTLVNVPITMSLTENIVSSIICSLPNSEDYIKGIMLQLLTLHNPKDLKIVILTSSKNVYKYEYLKLAPHLYSDDKSTRYFAENEEEAKRVINDIDVTYNDRLDEIKDKKEEVTKEQNTDDYYKNYTPYYLIITDNFRKYKNINFISKLVRFKKNVGYSLLVLDDKLKNLPNQCTKYAYIAEKESCLFEREYKKSNQIVFTSETIENLDMYRVARELSNIPVQSVSEIFSLPKMLSFLEMYNVGNIEQLNVSNKWDTSNPMKSLSCPIGVSESGELFKLDLHEKAHGPHGLIAGSTGSGKSEFIITYILSMAINYSPNEVQFVLIDYKGGGLAGAFENKETRVRLPHLAGTITNLDVSEMNRTLVSINSEMKRRQAKFNEVRDKLGESTIDIYKYQKYYREGLVSEPIPHLFIICDEFAELKAQQPEFMDELISTARIGRSLGVHLILATQKPSGVVNDQIWSNSRFKVCLKVQTKQDSNEMLKRPEAASIKDTGRFYLQVGYDELFELGQSAWAGATYFPTEKVIKKVDDSINFVDNTGEVIKSINNVNTIEKNSLKGYGDQLTNIVKYLNNMAIKRNLKKNQLWLDSIPEEIYLSNLMTKYKYQAKPYIINPIIGEYDDPEKQMQGLLTVDLTNTGNLLVYGIPGSGKENLVTTLVSSICASHTTDEVNVYLLDFGAETLGKFRNFPQVGDYVFVDDTERINSFITFLYKEINRRKTMFAPYGGTYSSFIASSGKSLPNIVCVVHQFEAINDGYSPIADKFVNLFKDGPKFGITFIVTNSLSSGIRMKTLQLFNNKLCLKFADEDEYRYVMDAPRGLIPSKYFGRGLVKLEDKTLEFQTAFLSVSTNVNRAVEEMANNLKKLNMKKAKPIPAMPKFLTVDNLINTGYTLKNVPVGISKDKLSIQTFDFSNSYSQIITSDVGNNMHFIYGLIELLKQIPNAKVRVIDVLDLYRNSQGVTIFNKDFNTIIKQIKLEVQIEEKGELDHTNIFIIIGLGAFKNNVPEATQKHFVSVFSEFKKYEKNKFIIYDDYNSYKSLEFEPWFKNVDKGTGIWLGDNAANQFSIRMPNLTMEERRTVFKQMGYVVKNSSHKTIKYIVDKEFDDEK